MGLLLLTNGIENKERSKKGKNKKKGILYCLLKISEKTANKQRFIGENVLQHFRNEYTTSFKEQKKLPFSCMNDLFTIVYRL